MYPDKIVLLFLYISVSLNHTKTYTLLFCLILILINLRRLLCSWVSVLFSFLWLINFQINILLYDDLVLTPNSSLFFLFYKSMFSGIFNGFNENWIIHQLKNFFLESYLAFFLSSAFISMFCFSQVFWLNLMTLWTFSKTNPWFNTFFICFFF